MNVYIAYIDSLHVEHLNKTEFTDIRSGKIYFLVPRIGWELNTRLVRS